MSSRMVRAVRPLPSPSALGFLETRGAVRQRVRVSPGTSGGEAVAVASLSPHDCGGGRSHSPCHSHSGMGWGGCCSDSSVPELSPISSGRVGPLGWAL